MQIQIRDYKFELSRTDQVMAQIENYLLEENLFLNYLVVDGKEIYEDFITCLQEQAEDNSKVEVIVLTQEEFFLAFEEELNKTAEKLLQEGVNLAKQFYSMIEDAGQMEKLVGLLEKAYQFKEEAEWFTTAKEESVSTQEHLNEISSMLVLFTEAMEAKDTIYIADLLEFELKSWFEHFLNKM